MIIWAYLNTSNLFQNKNDFIQFQKTYIILLKINRKVYLYFIFLQVRDN